MKEKIPQAVRTAVWNKYIGNEKGTAKCFVGCGEIISRSNFECGHIQAGSKGGKVTIYNLRPICSGCNRSMGTKNMREFMKKYGFTFENNIDEKITNETCEENVEKLVKIVSVEDNKVLDVCNNLTRPGTKVICYSSNNQKNQVWIITEEGYIQSYMDRDLVLDILGNEMTLCIQKKKGSDSQKWSVKGQFIFNKSNGYVLTNSSNLKLEKLKYLDNQKWNFEETNENNILNGDELIKNIFKLFS